MIDHLIKNVLDYINVNMSLWVIYIYSRDVSSNYNTNLFYYYLIRKINKIYKMLFLLCL